VTAGLPCREDQLLELAEMGEGDLKELREAVRAHIELATYDLQAIGDLADYFELADWLDAMIRGRARAPTAIKTMVEIGRDSSAPNHVRVRAAAILCEFLRRFPGGDAAW
jgi:hypothetical protein